MNKYFLVLIFAFLQLPIWAFNVTIHGNAKHYAGQEIASYHYNDFFNKNFEILQTAIINKDGGFELNLTIDNCEPIFFRIGYINASMFVQPEGNYEIIFPALNDSIALTINNTNQVDLLINNLSTQDINSLINDFEGRYVSFIAKHKKSLISKNFSALVDTFQVQLDSIYTKIDHAYFKNHVMYSLASLKLNSPVNKKGIYESYIFNKPILYRHSSYVSFIRLFYQNYLYESDIKRNKEEVLSAIDYQHSYNALIATMLQDDFLKNVQLAELVILNGLKDLSKTNYCSKDGIINILKLAQELCRFQENKDLAKKLFASITQFEKGYPAPSFALYDKRNKLISLNDFKGKYVYLGFWATWCTDCLRQMSVMKELHEQYGKDIVFVSISIDNDKKDMLAFLEKNPEYDWTILYAGNNIFLKENYDLRTVPNYFLIDSEGNHNMPFTKSPGNGIEPYFSQIQRKLHPIRRFVPGK
jgi:thiol-disulfide isomerase/thioredoxin